MTTDALLRYLEGERLQQTTRRHFLRDCTAGIGGLWLSSQGLVQGKSPLSFAHDPAAPLSPLEPQFAPKAKRVIYLHMVGAPTFRIACPILPGMLMT